MKPFRLPNSGFTLVEMLLAFFVLGLAASAGYSVFQNVISRYRVITDDALMDSQLAVASALLNRDLRSAYLSIDRRETLFVGWQAEGEPGGRLDFCQLREPDGEQVAEVGYFFKRSQSGSWQLWRRFQDTLDADPLNGGKESLVCRSLSSFEVSFFDGQVWSKNWGWDSERQRPFEGIRGLPLAVSIRLTVLSPHGREARLSFAAPIMTALLNKGHS